MLESIIYVVVRLGISFLLLCGIAALSCIKLFGAEE